MDAIFPFQFIKTQDHFGVGARSKAASLLDEAVAQLGEIENFSVKHNRDRARLVMHRLLSRGEVDDAKTSVRQAGAVFNIYCAVVRTTMADPVDHVAEKRWVGFRSRGINYPCDPAHDRR